jgi:hypothetical protein
VKAMSQRDSFIPRIGSWKSDGEKGIIVAQSKTR